MKTVRYKFNSHAELEAALPEFFNIVDGDGNPVPPVSPISLGNETLVILGARSPADDLLPEQILQVVEGYHADLLCEDEHEARYKAISGAMDCDPSHPWHTF